MTSWKFLFPTIRFFTARKASLGLAKRTKRMMGLGMEPFSPAQEAKDQAQETLQTYKPGRRNLPSSLCLTVYPGSGYTRILLTHHDLLRKP